MKKITLSLLAVLASINIGYSQANISVEAPTRNSTYIDIMPNGSSQHAAFHSVSLVNANELGALTGSIITGLGIQLTRGTAGPAVTGNFTVYLENTTDLTYSKSTSFSTAITTMTNCFSNTITIPVSTASSVISLNFPQSFTYTGGGLYVAVDWNSAGPFTANTTTAFAAYHANNGVSGTNMMAMESETVAPAPDVMTQFKERAAFLFRAVNTSTNELSVTKFDAPGKVAKLFTGGHTLTAEVKNSSTIAKSNVVVNLNVTGANSFVDTQTITSLSPGASASVAFSAFTPSTNGINNMTVSISADDNGNNNEMVRTESVTCNIQANNQNLPVGTNAVGFPNGTGMFVNKIAPATSGSISGVRIAIGQSANNTGKAVCGVLLDNTANIIAMTNTVTLTTAMLGAFRDFTFATSEALQGGTEYYIGLAQTVTGAYPMATIENPYGYQPLGYFTAPLAGGSVNQIVTQNYGYFGIEGIYNFDAINIELVANSDIVCRGDATTLTVLGTAANYTWSSNAGSGTAGLSNVIVTPTVTAPSISYNVRGKDAASGCLTNQSIMTVSVNACTGLMSEEKSANIKLFPNPTVNGKTSITGLEVGSKVLVLNLLGQTVLSEVAKEESVELDLTNFPNGNYLVKISDTNNQDKVTKLVN